MLFIVTMDKEWVLLQMKKQSSNHLISFNTYMLKPIIDGNTTKTRIIEHDNELIVPRTPIHIVRKSCHFYGNSLQSATYSARTVLKKRHKVPIVVAHDFGRPFVFLPTMSPTSVDNMWIALHAISYLEADKTGCIVHLANNNSVKVNVSDATIYRQYALGNMLKEDFLEKQKRLNGTAYFGPFMNH